MKTLLKTVLLLSFVVLFSCKKEQNQQESDSIPAQLQFTLNFDSTLPRLNNLAQPVSVPVGNAAQSPRMNQMSAHYIELAQTDFTALGAGVVLYHGQETQAGGSNAVNFDSAIKSGDDETFFSVDLSDVTPGTYKWIRLSLTYQNFEVDYHYDTTINAGGQNIALEGDEVLHMSSFVGFNTYITQHTVNENNLDVYSNKLQGFWMIEGGISYAGTVFPFTEQGQSDGTTVVNPNPSSPVPVGSCVVTGEFNPPLVITGNEERAIKVELGLSTNNSFEWKEVVENGKWDPLKGEQVVDMGLRGLHPRVINP